MQARNVNWLEKTVAGLALCALALLAGCSGATSAGGNPPPPTPTPAPPTANVVFCDSSDASCTPVSTVSVGSMRGLKFSVSWSNVPAGTHSQTVVLKMPDGTNWLAQEKAFLVDETANGFAKMTTQTPIAGTFIRMRGLTGDWTVQIWLDSDLVATRTLTFVP
jgi:hypothetical protein